MTSQLDIDQGGTSREWVRKYLGPSLGWVRVPSQNILRITAPGSYTLDLSTNFVEVNSTGSVIITLPSSKSSSAGAQAVPGTFTQTAVVIIDSGGHAAAHPITINALVGETVMGGASINLSANFGGYILQPLNDIGGWNSITPQGITVGPPPLGLIFPETYGAVGDGVTNDTAAVQAAVNFAVSQCQAGVSATVMLQQSYFISSTILVNSGAGFANLSIIGRSKTAISLTATAAISFIKFDTTSGNIDFLTVSDLGIFGNGAQNGIEFVGAHGIGYATFDRLFFNNLHSPFLKADAVTSGDDWNQFSDITAQGCTNGFNFRSWGTGTVFSGGNLVLSGGGAGFQLGVGGGESIGDFNIIGWQMGGSGTGIIIDGGTYGFNISVSQVQFDAGISPGWQLTNVHQLEARSINYGGAVADHVIDVSCTDLQLDERRAGYIPTGSTTLNDVSPGVGNGVLMYDVTGGNLTITGFAKGYDGRNLIISNSGTANSVILQDENVGSAVANRLHLGANVTLTSGQSIHLRYVRSSAGLSISNRWIQS